MNLLSRALPLLFTVYLIGCGSSGGNDNPTGTRSSTPVNVGNSSLAASSVAASSESAVVASSSVVSSSVTSSSVASSSVSSSVTSATASSEVGSSSSAAVVSTVTLQGKVTTFPSATVPAVGKAGFLNKTTSTDRFFKLRRAGDPTAASNLSINDMVSARALVSLFLLSDVDFTTPIATVKTDASGDYKVRAKDVKNYLIAKALIAADADEAAIISAFKALGKLQVRALVVKEENGVQQAMAIQSIADPEDVDESGAPNPVAVNPIVHRVVKAVVNSIRESINSLKEMGIDPAVVDQLTASVISLVSANISAVVTAAADDIIEIPEGQSLDSVVKAQEDEFKLELSANEVADLNTLVESDEQELTQEQQTNVEATAVKADEVVSDADSTLTSTLDSDSQGLLSGLDNILSESVNTTVDAKIEEEGAGSLFTAVDQTELDAKIAAQAEEKAKQLTVALQRFFLSMGLAIVVEQNEAGDAAVIAVNVQAPFYLKNCQLPGGTGFGDRGVRLFKIGEGSLSVNSAYSTVKPSCGEVATDSHPIAQPLVSVAALLPSQTEIDAAFSRINADQATGSEEATQADYELIDRVRVFHQLNQRLSEVTLVSKAVIASLVNNSERQVNIGYLAKVLATNFKWAREKVNLTPDGFPIFTGRRELLDSGASVIESSELVKALSLTLAEDPSIAAKFLTERLSFYARFSPDAVQSAIEKKRFESNGTFDVKAALAAVYPNVAEGYRDIVVGVQNGTVNVAPTPSYQAAKDRVTRGLTSAVPKTLFGRTLTSESSINIRSALFFMDLIIKSDFLIEKDKGYFSPITIPEMGDRFVPNFENYKFMLPNDTVTIGTLVSSLLSITQINSGENFVNLRATLGAGVAGLPIIPEFKEQNIEEIASDLGARAEVVAASCTIEQFDGTDPSTKNLTLELFNVETNLATGEFFKGESVSTVTVESSLVAGEGPARRTYTLSNIPTKDGEAFGREYVVKIKIPGYQNSLPELFLFADGFADNINLCDAKSPLFIGPDQQFTSIPGIGLNSDQSRPNSDGTASLEGVDLSNFEVPGAPIFVSSFEEASAKGFSDFHFASTEQGYAIMASSSAGFAPLYGEYQNGKLMLSIDSADGYEPLFGLHSIQSSNLRGIVDALLNNELLLEPEIALDSDLDNWQYDRLYLMRDAKGLYWVIELRFLDVYTEPSGEQAAFIDIGFAGINNIGNLKIPEAAFDDFGSAPEAQPGAPVGPMFSYLTYGDWLVIQRPDGYTGPDWLPPQQLAFGGSQDDYTQLAAATDGVFIRYAAEHFEENILTASDFDTAFGNPPEYSSIPVRIDAGRDGITFVKLSFNKQDRKYVMTPAPENASNSVSNLKHNNIIAIFDNTVNDGSSPVYLARVIRDKPVDDPWANYELALEVVPFLPSAEGDIGPAEVVCFEEDGHPCPTALPSLYLSSALTTAVGVVFDSDFDGVPFVFDANDTDPNIPFAPATSAPSGAGGGISGDGVQMFVMAQAVADVGAVKSLLLETHNVYPGDINAVTLTSKLFGEASGQQIVFTCTPPKNDAASGTFVDYQCSTRDLSGDVTIELHAKTGDRIAYQMTVPEATMAALSNRVDVDYIVSYRAPTDLQGQALMCGNSSCPARPNSVGKLMVRIPSEVAVIDDLRIAVGTDAPTDFSGLTSLDVTREMTISGASIKGAREYELSVFCAGSLPGEAFLPEEHMNFYAPAFDASGQSLRPEFSMQLSWLGGRSCNFTMEASVVNDAGDFVGISMLSFDDVILSGGSSGGEFINNEIKMGIDTSVCLFQDSGLNRVSTENCTAENILFTLQDTQVTDGSAPSANILLGANIEHAFIDGGRKDLTTGRLMANAMVSFNVNLDVPADVEIQNPTCGEISSDEFSYTCTDKDVLDVMTPFFTVSANGDSLALADGFPIDLKFAGGDTADFADAVSLLTPGFYALVDPVDGEKIVEIGIDTFTDADGTMNVFAHFTLVAGGNEYSGGDNKVLAISSPGYLSVNHNSGQPVDFDVRFIRDGVVKVAWFMPPPRRQLMGEHDVNGNGVSDLTLNYDAQTMMWSLIFAGDAKGVEYFGPNGPQKLEVLTDGTFAVSIEEANGFADFMLSLDSSQYQLYVRFENAGEGFIEWFEIFGGPNGPDGGPGDCFNCPMPLIDFVFKEGNPITLFDGGDLGFNTENEGAALVNIAIQNGMIVISLADSVATDISLHAFDYDLGQPVETNTVKIPFGIGALEHIRLEGAGKSLDIEVVDTGFDVGVRVFDSHSGEGEPSYPQPEMRDTDSDGVFDAQDNCILVANADQIDADTNGIGDVCEAVGPEFKGFYLAEISQDVGSMMMDDAGNCVVADDQKLLIKAHTVGSQLFIHSLDEGEGEGLHGLVASDGTFSLQGGDQFIASDGKYDAAANSISFTYTDDYSWDQGTTDASATTDAVVSCIESASVLAMPSTDTNEQAVFTNGGVTWIDLDSWEDNGNRHFGLYYGTIEDSQPEVSYAWNFETQSWETDIPDSEFFITDLGVVESHDVYTVTGYGDTGEGATVKPTANGQSVEGVAKLAELGSFDISGMDIKAVVGPIAEGSVKDVFSDGAIAYVTQLTEQSDSYRFNCDHYFDGVEFLELNCNNGIVIDWVVNADGSTTPVLASTLDDLILVASEATANIDFNKLMYIGYGHDMDGEFDIQAYLTSEDGTDTGANLMVNFVRIYLGGYDLPPSPMGKHEATLASIGGVDLVSFGFSPMVIKNMEQGDKGAGAFIAVESTIDAMPLVRFGRMAAAGSTETVITLNSIARDDIVIDFAMQIPVGEQPNCDMNAQSCIPPSGCDPSAADCQPPMECDPATMICEPPKDCDPSVEVCQPPMECDPVTMTCEPPKDCDPSVEVCQPPMECDPATMTCEPPKDCDPSVEVCQPPMECDPATMTCEPPKDCDPLVEVCQPPMECDPATMTCEPPKDCDPSVEVCQPPMECDPAIMTCEPPAGCDPSSVVCPPPTECDPVSQDCAPPTQPIGDAAQGKLIYEDQCAVCHGVDGTVMFGNMVNSVIIPIRTVYADLADLVQYNDAKMPYTAPQDCTGKCAEDVTAYLIELDKTFLNPVAVGF